MIDNKRSARIAHSPQWLYIRFTIVILTDKYDNVCHESPATLQGLKVLIEKIPVFFYAWI
ncbi:hypothetical protein KDW_49580 [Dictyobacter vulcani]|uniref:Uncharacterized protein n=1 Tax=Dictyobacter vulcani TaxID=2607529 RepID=A0A5J4KZY3_9CHLR|nr:hypothetical protein KDW_49580 [Dictyobacter vulcani]